jgi:PTS system mannose-specific IID component
MQNLGFAFAIVPLARYYGENKEDLSALLTRHIQSFNTHPYMAAPIIGSVIKMEQDAGFRSNQETISLKKALMGPYAAIGDSFFWGTMRSFSAIVSVILAVHGILWAPLLFLISYNPAHLWIRLGGFIEGYLNIERGMDFIKRINLPGISKKIRWATLVVLAMLAATTLSKKTGFSFDGYWDLLAKLAILLSVLPCFWAIKRGFSQVKIFYGMIAIFCIISYLIC